ncbi:MAG: 6-bladed beta-propeller [Proteiniphilum sp.]|nr:6-bladed beta-propeller [Proteiniphilum sp.]
MVELQNPGKMNNNLSLIFLLFVSGLILPSCNKGKTSGLADVDIVAVRVKCGTSDLISCDLSRLKDTLHLPLSLFIEDLQMVRLDNRDEALVSGGSTIITDNYILVRNQRNDPFKLFDKNGKFLTAVGSYGQGPGEYMNVYDEWMDEKSGLIFILPWQTDKLLRYNLKGEPLDPIPLRYRVPKGKIFVDAGQSHVSVFLLPFAGIPVVAWTQDFAGNMLDSIPAGHLSVQPDFSNEVFSGKNSGAFDCSLFTYFELRPDTLYHYNTTANHLDPIFTLDFKDKPRKIHWYEELPAHFTGSVTIEKKLSDNLSVTEYPANFIVEKKTLRGAYYKLYNDFLGDLPVLWASFNHGYYVWNVDPGEMAEMLTQHLNENKMLSDKDRRKLTEMLDSIDVNDNNYLFFGKLRQ